VTATCGDQLSSADDRLGNATQSITSFAPDQVVAEWFLDLARDHPSLVDIGTVLAVGLHPWVFRVAVAGGGLLAWRAGHRRAAIVQVTAMAAGGALGVLLKVVVQRPRPAWGNPVASELGFSMPSGHALNAALGCTLLLATAWPKLARSRRVVACSAAAVTVTLTAVDRMVLGVHYLSDVIAGATLGTVIGLVAALLLRQRGPRAIVRHG